MQKRYRALRFVSGLYKIIAILLFLVAIVGGIGAAFVAGGPIPVLNATTGVITTIPNQNPLISSVIAFVATFISGAILAISLYAFANLIDLLIATEENTRLTAALLNRVSKQLRPAPRAPARVVE
jgi:hypothetical protein